MTDATRVVADALQSAAAPCLTCSFQAEDVVVVDLVRGSGGHPGPVPRHLPSLAETLAYRDQLAARWSLNLVDLRAAEPSVGLWQTSTTDCCARHKVGPLFSALEEYDTWFTGLRREQSPSRASLEPVEDFRLPSGKHLVKISPLALWTTKEVWSYAKAHAIPLLPLDEAGYSSIGCEPCTTVPLDPLNPRSGRWAGQKLECGIHIQPVESK